jgi:chromosome partitioning protein
MIISILNQKGGVAKTTLSVNLTRSFTKKGKKTLLVDCDSQGSSLDWHVKSGGELIDVACLPKETLEKDIKMFVDTYDYIFLDGMSRVSPVTICALRCSDIILIPVTPCFYDIKATHEIVRHAKDRMQIMNGKVKSALIITRIDSTSTFYSEVEHKIKEFDLPIFESKTHERMSYVRSVEKGVTVLDGQFYGSKACKEIESISNELEEFINGLNHNDE